MPVLLVQFVLCLFGHYESTSLLNHFIDCILTLITKSKNDRFVDYLAKNPYYMNSVKQGKNISLIII